MCGLAGFLGIGDEHTLRIMTDAMVHRGPDGEGSFCDKEKAIYLGHKRLAIIDPHGGHQPMWSKDKQIAVIFNGEIYNHRYLRKELEEKGHQFVSKNSDTEVLVHGWKAWGEEMFSRIDGMFALCIYDRLHKTVTLARDRIGEKPLYYAARKDSIVFASELGSLLLHPTLQNSILSKTALQKFFSYGFFPAPFTPYADVYKVKPGQIMTVNTETFSIKSKKYWSFMLGDKQKPSGTVEDWTIELEYLLQESVKSRMEADVPLGFFLSGGIDSSAITSLANDSNRSKKIKTFSIGFQESSFDETKWADEVALLVNSQHLTKKFNLENAQNYISKLPNLLSEPISDPSILPTHMLCGFAKEHINVALSGDGSDELFAGYDPFLALRSARLYHNIMPKPIHAGITHLANQLPISDANMSIDFIIRRSLGGLSGPPNQWNPRWLGPLMPDQISDLFNEPIDPEDLYSEAIDAWDNCPSQDIVDKSLDFFTRFYLPDNILTKTDRASMSVGLELRNPFLSNAITEFVQRLPADVKLRGTTTKWVLKQALKKQLPHKIINRKKKGFGIPIAKWLRKMDQPEQSIEHIDNKWLGNKWKMHKRKSQDNRLALWAWVALANGLNRSA